AQEARTARLLGDAWFHASESNVVPSEFDPSVVRDRQEDQMTSKADFTDEEWTRLRRSPFVAGLAISMADPGGPIEMAKETMATLRIATTPPSQEELLVAVAQEIASMMNQKENPLKGFKPDSA